MSGRPTSACLVVLGVFLAGCGGSEPEATEPSRAPAPAAPRAAAPDAPATPLSVDITIDATEMSSWLRVREEWSGVTGAFSVRKHGDGGAYSFRNVRYTSNGEDLGVRPKANRFEIRRRPIPSEVTVTYEVRPGVDGRHGRQGWADDRFAVFDGRALLLPIAAQPLTRARFRFELPEGWSPATALTQGDDGWWVADPPAGSVLLERLLKECHGLGPWERQDVVLGDTEVRSFVHGELAPELKQQVMDDTEAVWGWFHEEVGFDPGYPMAFIRTPSNRGGRIFGGASMMGACYEAEWSHRPERNRYLLGHRFGHPFNKYPPVGLTPHGPDEHWFTEGWASYAEVMAIEGTGRIPSGTYFPKLWDVHRDRVQQHPSWLGYPMVDEGTSDKDQREYLHYFRGPLLVRTLAHLVEERSDTDLEAFVKHLAAEHGNHARPYHLQEELEAFTGASFADFWAAYVHGRVWVAPSFPGIVDADVRDRAAAPMLASSSGVGLDANYLATLAASGRFHDVGELLDFAGGEGPTRRALSEAGVQLAPDVVLEHAAGLPPLVRESLVRAEADWPVHTLGRLRAQPEPALRWNDAHPMAAAWKAWRRHDEEDRLLTLAGGIALIALRVGDKDQAADRPDVLAVPPDRPFTLYVWWREPRAAVRIDLLHGDEVVWSTPVVEQPGWIRNRLVLDVGDRPAGPGMLTVRVHGQDGSVLGQRRFLQWQPDAAAD